jgi:hypothetical protein
LINSDHFIIRQSIDLFTKYTEAITNGNLKVEYEMMVLSDLCLEANINTISPGLYNATPRLEPVWEAIDEQTFKDTDWWMVITPSAVPEGEDFEDDEFITGGMGADNKGGPLFIADDSWLIRKPYHLGDGLYTEIERRAYLPQWYQHEFYHHLYRIYPEFELEVNGHDWFNRNFWPNDFEGLYEPDYYAESLYKRLQTACVPMNKRLITTSPEEINQALFSQIEIEDLLGEYSLDNVGNPWHRGEIIQSGATLFWRNAANVQWELTPRLSEGFLETGPDCPYPGNDHFIELATNEIGEKVGVNSGFSFNGDFYRRRFKKFFNSIPVELSLGKYTSVRSTQAGTIFREEQSYLWKDQDDKVQLLVPNYDQGRFDIDGNQDQPLEIIRYSADCIQDVILGLKSADDLYTGTKIDPENQAPQLTKPFEHVAFEGRQPITLQLTEYFEDPEGDELLYFVFYDQQVVVVNLLNDAVEIDPVESGESTVTIFALDPNRGAVYGEFEVTVVNEVLSVDPKVTFGLYPNPVDRSFHLNGFEGEQSYVIYSMSGK